MQVKKFIYEYLDIGEAGLLAAAIKNDNEPTIAELLQPVAPIIVDTAPKAIYTEEELQLAKAVAKEEGIRLGQELAKTQFLEAETKKTENLAELVQKIEQQVANVAAETERKLGKVVEELKIVAVAAARKATGGDVNAEAVEQFVKDQIKKLSSKGNLKIITAPTNVELLAGRFKNTSVEADEAMAAGDFRIEWDGGYAERNSEEIWKEIENILKK